MAMFTHQIGISNTLATVGIIGESFGIDNPGQLSWLIAGFALTVGTFILIGGRLGDEYGHKRLFLIGLAWYSLWSLVAGVSVYSSHVLFVFARVFQGMGPALTLPNALAMLGSSYSPGPRQNMSFAWFAASAPFGAIAGFLFGGLFALAWWPWIYWSQALGLAVYALCALWTIPSPAPQPKPKRSIRQVLTALDVLGGLTGVLALVLFNFAWNQAVIVSWHEPYVYVCLILGVLFGVAFFYIELRWASSPILPVAAFNSDIAFVFGCVACGWACFGIWVSFHRSFNQLINLMLHADLLLHSNGNKHWRPNPNTNGSLVHTCSRSRPNFGSCSGQIDGSDSYLLYYGHWRSRISGCLNPRGHPACRFDVLDLFFLQHIHHSHWHGHLIPSRDNTFLQSSTSGVSGYGRKYHYDDSELQHIAGPRLCWYC